MLGIVNFDLYNNLAILISLYKNSWHINSKQTSCDCVLVFAFYEY